MTTGFLALVGGDEFKSGNDEQDRLLVEHQAPPRTSSRRRPRASDRPAVASAQRWFKPRLDVVELPLQRRMRLRRQPSSKRSRWILLSVRWRSGLVVDVLHEVRVARHCAGVAQGRRAGRGRRRGDGPGQWSRFGAYPGHAERRCKPALGLVPRVAVAPHFETFGHRWVDSVLAEPPAEDVVIAGIDERSAALWDGQKWTARGPGRITVITRDGRDVSQSGASVALPLPDSLRDLG
jgi:hypothetical protein